MAVIKDNEHANNVYNALVISQLKEENKTLIADNRRMRNLIDFLSVSFIVTMLLFAIYVHLNN